MSGFAALGDFEGDLDEIVEQRQKQKVEKETAKLKEQAASKLKFEELKAKAGRGAWGDSDDEGDMFASPQMAPTAAAPPPGLGLDASGLVPDDCLEDGEEEEQEEEEEAIAEEEQKQDEAAAAAAALAAEQEAERINARKAKKEEKQARELAELDSMMAQLNGPTDGPNGDGVSKAAAKRAKKKAKEAGGAGAAEDGDANGGAAEEGEPAAKDPAFVSLKDAGALEKVEAGDGEASTAGKSPEEIKAMMKAKADAAAKNKKKGKPGGGAAAAAQAELKARGASGKKKQDKSRFNQMPC